MKPTTPSAEHFKGKTVSDHLKDARLKGAMLSTETHSSELPGSLFAGIDSSKDTAFVLLFLFATQLHLSLTSKAFLTLMITFSLGWVLWKAARSALLGWARLERLHKVIEEERWEIQHHREQEKEELREMYQAKGFKGKLLDEIVEVLMSDDNRLLQIMLEEELGLSLEVYDHPLKQAFSAAKWTLLISAIASLSYYLWPAFGLPLFCLLCICLCAYLGAHFEKRPRLTSLIWNLSIALFSSAAVYFLGKILKV